MALHKLQIDSQAYSDESNNEDLEAIVSHITEVSTEIDVKVLSSQLILPASKTWIPANIEREGNSYKWKSQSIFALAFSNTMSFDHVLERLHEYSLHCTFAYINFADSEETEAFTVVFQLESPIIDVTFRDTVQLSLMTLFPEADESCKDVGKMLTSGEELIFEDYDYYLDIDILIEAAQFYGIRNSSSKNISRDLGRISKKLGIDQISINGRDNHSPYIYSIESVENASKIIDFANDATAQVRSVDFEKLRQEIRILDEFMNPANRLGLLQLIGLATNLKYLEGGQKLFKECLNANPEYATAEKQNVMAYCRIKNYYPTRLESFSPYEEDWEYTTLLRAAKRKDVIRLEPYLTISVEEARERLQTILLDEVIPSNDTDIHVIKVPTAVGKTQLCTTLDNVVIAFPNHALKSEVSDRMQVDYLITPELENLPFEVQSRLNYYYSIGANKEAIRYLQNIAKENKIAKEYLDSCAECYNTSKTVLTTHQRALFSCWSHNTLIFDEDMLSTLLPMSKVIVSDFIRLEEMLEDEKDKEVLQGLITDILEGKISGSLPKKSYSFSDIEAIEESILSSSITFDSDVLHFFNADCFMVDPFDKVTIHYIRRCDFYLPSDKKVIILSATANETLYKQFLGDRLRFYDIGNVKLTGLIEQDIKYSFSRASLSRNIEKAIEKAGELPTITFKTFKDNFANPVEDMHFWKTTGSNNLRGQDIAVVGTPHTSPIVLHLYAQALGMQVSDGEVNGIGQKCVIHNGFRFWFNAYGNENLRLLQFYFIESELRQAIGRARANTELAHVHLYSNYPLPEAAISDKEKTTGRQRLEELRKTYIERCLDSNTKVPSISPEVVAPGVSN